MFSGRIWNPWSLFWHCHNCLLDQKFTSVLSFSPVCHQIRQDLRNEQKCFSNWDLSEQFFGYGYFYSHLWSVSWYAGLYPNEVFHFSIVINHEEYLHCNTTWWHSSYHHHQLVWFHHNTLRHSYFISSYENWRFSLFYISPIQMYLYRIFELLEILHFI